MNSVPEEELRLWHYEVHDGFGEHLCYLFINFYPTYNHDLILDCLKAAFVRLGVGGWCAYEIYGEYDIVVRLWTREALNDHFELALREHLEPCKVIEIRQFLVQRPIIHWPWMAPSGDPEAIDQAIRLQFAPRDIMNVQKLGRQSHLYDKCIEGNLLKPLSPDGGIKFFILLSQPHYRNLPRGIEASFLKRLQYNFIKNEYIGRPSIYKGVGHGWILLKGMVNEEDYFAIQSVIASINAEGLESIGIRTTTYLVASKSAMHQQDVILFDRPGDEADGVRRTADITALLNQEEGATLECKGTLYLDLKRLWNTGQAAKNDVLVKEVLGAITAFLNTGGGDLIIGLAETNRIPGKYADNYPKVGIYSVIGINEEYQPDKGWDGYVVRLTDLVATHIGKEVIRYLDIDRHEVEGRDLCVVSTAPSARYHYCDGGFYVRLQNQTRLLSGEDQDKYQREHHR